MAGSTKPTGMVRTIICPGKTLFPFNCERNVICYSAIYYSWTSGYGEKLFSLGISGVFKLRTDWGSESEQFHWLSIDSDMDICEASGSDSVTESSEQVEPEHVVSIQFVVVSASLTLACPSGLSGLKEAVARIDLVCVMASPSCGRPTSSARHAKLKEPKDFFI